MWQIAAGLFLGIVLLRPLHLLLHELGHAAAILALTSTVPTVRIGHGPSRNAAPLGRLLIQWGAGGWLRADCGYESGSVGRHARVAIAAAGPAASFAAMVGSVLLGALASAPWIQATLLGSAWVHGRIFATSAWPRGGARPSDGAQIRNLLDRSAG
jgi:hypothetical protein